MSGFDAQREDTTGDAAESGLGVLRAEIDRIDASLHALLMERGEIIDRLIAVKARSGGASAFRPAREAAMMRRLVERHAGILPLATVEGIWRIIISTFTYVQSPYAVHADMSPGMSDDAAAAMRDAARFHFGFTVPLRPQGSAAAVVAAVAQARNDLGLLRCDRGEGAPWWDALRDPAAPKVIARLPFVERADHAAGLPLFVIAKVAGDGSPAELAEVALYAAREGVAAAPLALVDRRGGSMLVTAPGAIPFAAVAATLADPVPVGSHAAPFAAPPSAASRPETLLRLSER